MSRFALVHKDTGEKLDDQPATRFRGDPPVFREGGKPWIWLPIVRTKPDWDRITERLDGPVENRVGDEWHKVWTLRAATDDEMNMVKDIYIWPDDDPKFKVARDIENRVRALEGETRLSPAEYREILRGLV